MSAEILLIEDDARLADMVKDYLGQSGFEVTIAATGGGGLAAADKHRYDIVVLDLMLPDIDGLDVCRSLRSKSDLPILMLTAKGDP
ncbi:MAG: response regulator, partial [Hyphomicrobiaceae bacterium]